MKKRYTSPKLTIYGKIGELTEQVGSGDRLDQDFSQNASTKSLTFS